MGLTTPMTVTTMRFMAYQDTSVIRGVQVHKEGQQQTAVGFEPIIYKNLCSVFVIQLTWCPRGARMPPVGLQGKLLEMSERPLSLLYVAYRQCYSPRWAGDMWEEDAGEGRKDAFLREMMRSGHDSPLEHVKFTFAIAGVSRALTHQLVRYRVASYSQQSQRYVDMRHFGYVIPPSIAGDETLRAEFERCMAEIQQSYQDLLARFGEKGIVGERAHEDARVGLH